MMKDTCGVKIVFIIFATLILSACNAIKRVPDGQKLLVENIIRVDSLKPKDSRVGTLPVQQPNQKIPLINYPLRLHIYNLARPNRDSIYLKWMQENPEALKRRNAILSEKQTMRLGESLVGFNNWLKRTGEAPVLIEKDLIEKSKDRLRKWYWNQGYFNAEVDHKVLDLKAKKRSKIAYYINRHEPYFIDSLKTDIKSPALDSLYELTKDKSLIISGEQYFSPLYSQERDRLFSYMRNRGAYYLEKENIRFEADTVNTGKKVNSILKISQREIREEDSSRYVNHQLYRIKDVIIAPDVLPNEVQDTVVYNGYKILVGKESKYRPKSLTDAVFTQQGDIYRDLDRSRTYKRITELRSFFAPSISYYPDPNDSTSNELIARIDLQSKKKFELNFVPEATHSNIQAFGIGLNTSLLMRNIFRGSETLDISFRGNVGASANASNGDTRFFDLQELGADAKLTFPRMFIPIRTDSLIPKYMSPSTDFSLGFFSQTNIGLDKQSVNGGLSYNWEQTPIKSTRVDLVNAQYVRNLDPDDFFSVYQSSYGSLNDIADQLNIVDPTYVNENQNLSIPDGTRAFTRDVLNGTIPTNNDQLSSVRNIEERRDRLSQDNLIISSSYNWVRNNRQGIYDNDFSRLSLRLEVAGNVLSAISDVAGIEESADGKREVFGVEYSQYVKPEIDYIKHWQYVNGHVFAIRTFGGIAIPYGNSDNIPFIRSFFAGGPNDNRAWQAYELGPGSTGGINDFNEANMKIALNAEYRFPIAGAFQGAVFADAGNIWNVLDSEDNPDAIFRSWKDLSEIALGTGFGIRYDFGFFVLRFDTGFKTYDPGKEEGDRWLNQVKLSDAVLNVGINYPF
ncbi:translocation and assembly module lipoprotein TamL [Nonlabens spongiae]|nr:BamA/TamA family outer membrane protein [Nonlabens spongiae]